MILKGCLIMILTRHFASSEKKRSHEDIKKLKQVTRKPVATNSSKKQGQVQKSMKKLSVGGESRNDEVEGDDDDDDNDIKNRSFENGHSKEEMYSKSRVNSKENGNTNARAFDVNKLQKLRAKGGKNMDPVVNKVLKEEPKKKVGKKNRVWDEKPAEKKLDFTDPVSENGNGEMVVLPVVEGESMMDKDEIFSSDSETVEDDEATNDIKVDAKKKGWFTSMFQSIAGKANLDKEDLEPALKALKDRLMTKNVAEEIAEKLCESVAASLVGKKLASFTRISSTGQAAMEDALVRILTPKRSIDILRDVHVAKEQRKPYVVVFVGVNSIGKSTNLAKVGAALSMVYISGAPVMFVGCGQSYTDLKKLNVKSIVKTLLK